MGLADTANKTDTSWVYLNNTILIFVLLK